MFPVVLTLHSILVIALVVVVLLQRSEGGALGIGGGGGGGMMSGRGAANVLTRTTTVLAALFFATSLGLALMTDTGETREEVLQRVTGEGVTSPTGGSAVGLSDGDIIDLIGDEEGQAPAVPNLDDLVAPVPEPTPDVAPADETPEH